MAAARAESEPSRASGGPRRRAREICLRALYRWEVAEDPLAQIAAELEADESLPEDVRSYAVHLVSLVLAGLEEIDRLLVAGLQRWDLKRLAVIDRSILRLGTAELLFEPQLPTGVVLDECIEIAKRYGSAKSGKFVNGVLDGVARSARGPAE